MSDEQKERDEVILAIKELNRQAKALYERDPDSFEKAINEPGGVEFMEAMRTGEISIEAAQAEIERMDEEFAETVRELDDPAAVTQLETEHEASARQLHKLRSCWRRMPCGALRKERQKNRGFSVC